MAAGLDEAPVDVDVVSDSRTQVVAIPVTALVALREGGYAVEVLQADGSTRLVGVEPGFFADVTIFNPDTVIDRATYTQPFQYPIGFAYVIVNGTVVLKKGTHTGAKPGRALRRN